MVDFVLDERGLEELCKGAEMQAGLREVAEKVAASANNDALSRPPKMLHITEWKVTPPYAAAVDVLSHTAVGVAFGTSKMAAINEAKFKSLSKQLH